eukprot:2468411-Amphidinium_carterae.1
MPMLQKTSSTETIYRYTMTPTEDVADKLEGYSDLTMAIRRKKRDTMSSISQSFNYVLAHSTKPGSQPHSMI